MTSTPSTRTFAYETITLAHQTAAEYADRCATLDSWARGWVEAGDVEVFVEARIIGVETTYQVGPVFVWGNLRKESYTVHSHTQAVNLLQAALSL